MCGIAGIVGLEPERLIKSMLDTIEHRATPYEPPSVDGLRAHVRRFMASFLESVEELLSSAGRPTTRVDR